ncbi:hypothetical protein [Cellulomonas triticagri]|uniref:hypothetical protein n=1 Tax=Cellulomonas triticagri TaxID=2483352 RepID=UPI001315A0F5|nr:hypothetical protein [Cellulomonas triticagri]
MTVRTQQTIATVIAMIVVGALSVVVSWQWWQLGLVVFPVLVTVLLMIWWRDKERARS